MTVTRMLLLGLALLHASGLAEVIRRATCAAECERDGCANDCLPGDDGPSCLCHCPTAPAATPPVVAVHIAAAAQTRAVTFERTERPHRSPDPREIQHVPRPYAV